MCFANAQDTLCNNSLSSHAMFSLLSHNGRTSKGGRDSNEPPVPLAGSPLHLTLLFLYIIPNLILNDTHQHFVTLVSWAHRLLAPSPPCLGTVASHSFHA